MQEIGRSKSLLFALIMVLISVVSYGKFTHTASDTIQTATATTSISLNSD